MGGRVWTEGEIATLRAEYPTRGRHVSALLPGRSPETCTVMAGLLGVTVDWRRRADKWKRICGWCERSYINKNGNRLHGEGTRYCSRACAYDHKTFIALARAGDPKRSRHPPRCSVFFPNCLECGRIFTARLKSAAWCSARCRSRNERRDNPDRIRASQKKWKSRNRDVRFPSDAPRVRNARYRDKYRSSTLSRKQLERDKLAESYVRRMLSEQLGIPATKLPVELIEAKRIQLQLTRLIKGEST
jgi:hypothetical protein